MHAYIHTYIHTYISQHGPSECAGNAWEACVHTYTHTYISQHGPSECAGNAWEVCLQHLYQSNNVHTHIHTHIHTYTSQHGPSECAGNAWEACVQHLYPKVTQFFPVLECIEDRACAEGQKAPADCQGLPAGIHMCVCTYIYRCEYVHLYTHGPCVRKRWLIARACLQVYRCVIHTYIHT
jgi:hypothetical protein